MSGDEPSPKQNLKQNPSRTSEAPDFRRGLPRVSVRQTRRSTGIAFLAWTIAVYDFILFGTLLPRIQEDFAWDNSTALLVSALVSAGTAVFIFIIGPILDRVGRRRGLVISAGGTAVSSALTSAVAGPLSLIGVRSVSGLGLAEQSINATYLNEIYAVSESKRVLRNRGFIFSLVQAGWPLGALLAAAFAWGVGSLLGLHWRVTFLLATIPAIVVALLCLRLRETPQFLAQRQIARLRKQGEDAHATEIAMACGLEKPDGNMVKRIFSGKHLRNTIFFSIAWIFNWFGIQSFSVLGTSVLEQGKGIAAQDALLMIVVSNVVAIIGYLTFGWLGDRFGRRRVILIGWLLAGISFAIMLLGPSEPAFVLVPYFLGLFFMGGPYSALLFYTAECYDTDCRATGSTFTGAMSQPGAIIAGFLLFGLIGAGVTWSYAALLVGAGGLILSALAIAGTKPVSSS